MSPRTVDPLSPEAGLDRAIGLYNRTYRRLREVILTEMAEVWSRRNTRARLHAGAQQREALWPVPPGAATRTAILYRALESDREHLKSLRRILAALR